MQSSLIKKAQSAIEKTLTSSSTNVDDDLFQMLKQVVTISPFVAEVVTTQCQLLLAPLIWHFENSSDDFSTELSSQIATQLFVSQLVLDEGYIPQKSEYLAEFQSEQAIMAFLRKSRRLHSASIAILELSGHMTIEQSSARMSCLAECLTQTAYLWSYSQQQVIFGKPVSRNNPSLKEKVKLSSLEAKEEASQNLLILAMGKFGGDELNFSSDIDLIFFYSADGETEGGKRSVSNSRFFQKVGVLLIKLLNEGTEDGFVFRVDMRLRPYGDSGNLVMSVDQAEDYYHEQGRGWERFAMVRARIITGLSSEKLQLEAIITPFAFRRYIDYGVIDSLRNMKEMIQREVRRRGLKDNIKLGAGGIREIEFMVQSLQLIQGGRDKRLQQRNLLKVLPLLAEVKLLPESTSIELAENYRFLRRLEHCIQELEEKQTQQLPTKVDQQKVIAEVMGFCDWQDFYVALQLIHKKTNQHFSALFGEERVHAEQQDEFFVSLWEGHISAEQLNAKIPVMTESSAAELLEQLFNFRRSNLVKNLSARGAKRLKLFFPNLLSVCLLVDNPQKTLTGLLQILKAILKRTAYLELLSENLPILQHLVDLVSGSDWIVQRLSECPILFDELLYPNSLYEPLQTSDLQSELRQSLLRIDSSDEEQMLDAIRRFKQINELRVAAALLSEKLSISQISRYLTQLAQVIIQTALDLCWQTLAQKYGIPEALLKDLSDENQSCDMTRITNGFAVVAYGKLGGNELGFSSDLDLVFLFDQPLDGRTRLTSSNNQQRQNKTISSSRFYTRLAQKLIHFLSTRTSLGVLYEVDMRLRPSGNSGLLVSHIDAFESYQKENAWTWEHQALVRARVVAGDTALANKFEVIRFEVIHSKRNIEKLKLDVVEMRQKMRQQLDQSNQQQFDLKQGVGGLVDIEFLAQYLILSASANQTIANNGKQIVPSNTVDAFKYAQQIGLINNDDSLMLIKVFRVYRNYINQLTLVGGEKLLASEQFYEQRKSVEILWQKLLG